MIEHSDNHYHTSAIKNPVSNSSVLPTSQAAACAGTSGEGSNKPGSSALLLSRWLDLIPVTLIVSLILGGYGLVRDMGVEIAKREALEARLAGFEREKDQAIVQLKEIIARFHESVAEIRKQNAALKLRDQITLNRGTTAIPLGEWVGGSLMSVRIEGYNYDYRYLIAVSHNGFAEPGICSILSTNREFNMAGFGPPRFSVDARGHLLVSNPEYPVTGLKAHYSALILD